MEFFHVTTEGYVAIVTINRPPANALSSAVLKELSSVLDELEQNEHVRVIILRGEGRFFCAGADIKEFTLIETKEEATEVALSGQQLMERVEQFKKPIIAAIHGAALGGGLELAMSCHLRVVAENAKLGLPELQLGIIPGFAGTQRLLRYVGAAKALEMMWTSEPITGTEAVQWGLANVAVPEENVLGAAKQLAEKIARKSPLSIQATLQLLNDAKVHSFHECVKKEAELFGQVFVTEDAKEGISAFIEKRTPQFQGK
ncbi:enoyl-CoA hydratase [Thermolongibacillus altinsuensis]|uniref:enoyl-CoA hydratase n=1 Tax=Thermolongibacillus altinsuensis TaxID=575256 RepID=UPI00242A2E2E|nr:enoyl-CoA hydratase [Thermolongibacillus altinsuensis]GMB07403.1 putative enoyl-CoA hydratase [Thermolongibacillus altinsuensis]